MMTSTRFGLFAAGVLVAACAAPGAPSSAPAEKRETQEAAIVFEEGREGYPIYRIPAIIQTLDGRLVAFAEARQGGDQSETDLVIKTSDDNGSTWSALSLIIDDKEFASDYPVGHEITVGNPSPVVITANGPDQGDIVLVFNVENSRVFATRSADNAASWSPPVEVTASVRRDTWGWYATGPGHAIELKHGNRKGRIVVASDHRLGKPGTDTGPLAAHVIYSDDAGRSWALGAVDESYDDGLNANETTAAELPDGTIYFNTRNHRGQGPSTRGEAYSDDAGETFRDPLRPFAYGDAVLDPPVVQASVLALDGGALLFSAPDNSGPTGEGRSDLSIRWSSDGGYSWADHQLLHVGPVAYSDMVKLGKERVGILYEAGLESPYERILFKTFNAKTPAASADETVKASDSGPPNILFIAVDDMNDWTTLFDPRNPIKTPNLERLAARGTFFERAYAASPACSPSRAALMTGIRPHRSGVYSNASDWRDSRVQGFVILQKLFKDEGYFVGGAGKIFHHHDNWRFHDNSAFHEFLMMRINEPYPAEKISGSSSYGSINTDWGPWPPSEEETADFRTVSYAEQFLKREHSGPFFLNVGIYKPHSPFYAPQPYFDRYPLNELVMPDRLPDDTRDVPAGARAMLGPTDWFWSGMEELEAEKPGSYRSFVQAYQSVSGYADTMIGRVLDALDASPYRDNTIIVLWSDHGFQLGEKDRIEKFALWEKATRVPYIIVLPGSSDDGRRISEPVDLMTVYPTLVDLAGLEGPSVVDGVSLKPLLMGKQQTLPPALMTYLEGNHAVRKGEWRYIQYADGSEELYNVAADPGEHTNLAEQSDKSEILEMLRAYIPLENAPAVAEKTILER